MELEGVPLCFPQFPNASCRRPDPPDSEAVLVYLLLYFMSVLTAALNLVVIISISHFRQLHTPTNFILLSLAVSDFFMGLLVMPVEILMTQACWMLGDLVCAAYYLLPFVIISASVGNMVLISVDRYVAICDPLHYPTRITKKKIQTCVCLCWLYSVFVNVLILYDHMKTPGKYNSCLGECLVGISGDADLVLGFVIPIAIIIVLYLRIFLVAASHARAMRPLAVTVTIRRSKALRARGSEMKAAGTLSVVVAVFLVCYCPYYAVTLTGRTIMIGSSTEIYMVFVMYFNSCLNPVIYAFFYPWFRKCLRLIVALHICQPGSCETNIL